jgi:hypothetical protein
MKNADAPAVKREAEEDWGNKNGEERQEPFRVDCHRTAAPT